MTKPDAPSRGASAPTRAEAGAETGAPAAGEGEPSLQDRFAPHNACFGCGPQNEKGLRLKSHAAADGSLIATFHPEPHHEAFPGVLNGGIIGALLDCHSNWMAAYALMLARGEATPPCTVTAEFHVKLRHPTPTDVPVALVARAVQLSGGSRGPRAAAQRWQLQRQRQRRRPCRIAAPWMQSFHPAARSRRRATGCSLLSARDIRRIIAGKRAPARWAGDAPQPCFAPSAQGSNRSCSSRPRS